MFPGNMCAASEEMCADEEMIVMYARLLVLWRPVQSDCLYRAVVIPCKRFGLTVFMFDLWCIHSSCNDYCC